MTIRNGTVEGIEFTPLDLDEGETYRSAYDDLGFLTRRGLAEVATGAAADSILARLLDLSEAYGTYMTTAQGKALLEFR